MNQTAILPIGATLAKGSRLFNAGLVRAFPYILAAEMLSLLRPASSTNNIMNADLGQLFNPVHLGWMLLLGCVQALLYGIAIIQLPTLADHDAIPHKQQAVRSIPALLIGYLIYELIVIVGLGFAMVFFLPTTMLIGPVAGVLSALIPLAPTAYFSTAFALFAYPAVLERKGPLAALFRSMQLTRSHWTRAALIISVPAFVLLAIAAGNEIPFFETLRTSLHQLTDLSSGMDVTQLQNLLSNPKIATTASHPLWWSILFSILTACGWWYALAVCYAEYRELSNHLAH